MKQGAKRWLLATLGVLILLGGGTASAQTEVFNVDRELYPYYPSLIKWNKSGAEFTEPETCGGCHPQQYEEWTGSVHALAFQDPVYQGELVLAVKAVGHNISRQCEGCHSPAGVVTGEIKGPGLKGLSPMAMAGVSCDICHSVSGVTHWQTPAHEPENGSMILTPGVETLDGTVLIKRGPSAPEDGCGGGFHECEQSDLHQRADLCASCHQVYHYAAHYPLEATYVEWKHGPYAQKGILCQDCHMVDTPTFLRTADTFEKPSRGEYHHYFNGANYLLYHLARAAAEKSGDAELVKNLDHKFQMSVDRLKAAAELEIAPLYGENTLQEVRVRVKNVRAGHNLPTSLTNIREMWLEVTVKDGQGKILYASGGLDEQGRLQENTRVFNSEGADENFHFVVNPWEITSFSKHDTIPPRGYKDVHYGVAGLPKEGRLEFEARLRYRQADQKIAEKLLSSVPADINLEEIYGLKAVPQLPVVDMATAKASIGARP